MLTRYSNVTHATAFLRTHVMLEITVCSLSPSLLKQSEFPSKACAGVFSPQTSRTVGTFFLLFLKNKEEKKGIHEVQFELNFSEELLLNLMQTQVGKQKLINKVKHTHTQIKLDQTLTDTGITLFAFLFSSFFLYQFKKKNFAGPALSKCGDFFFQYEM